MVGDNLKRLASSLPLDHSTSPISVPDLKDVGDLSGSAGGGDFAAEGQGIGVEGAEIEFGNEAARAGQAAKGGCMTRVAQSDRRQNRRADEGLS
jgi:hypothetical protein